MFYESLKPRIKYNKLTQKELSERLDDPTREVGPYFMRKNPATNA